MNGAEALIATLIDAGVNVCFANPGTSEMQLVAAIDKQEGMRAILCLFEGVATGAADGYGRMADKPAATLLHLGPGLANGLANLHNARRARSPVVNLVGDHATYHLNYDAPLTSDVVGVAGPMSDFVATSRSPDGLAEDGAAAVAAALEYPGKVATVIVPANHAWEPAERAVSPKKPKAAPRASASAVHAAVEALKKGPCALFLGGRALREDALDQAGRIAAASGARLICETFPARLQRGAGRVAPERLPYFGEMAAEALKEFSQLIMVGAKAPVAFFAYPGKPGWLSPKDANIVTLADPREDALAALTALADELRAPTEHGLAQAAFAPPMGTGKLDAAGVGAVVAAYLPENAIVSDEAATAGMGLFPMTQGAARHDWMTLTGGSIGQGLPLGVGAAVACPERKVVCLQADGSAMYTVQALWTMARENLDVATVILNNGSYAILNIELMRVGAGDAGAKARQLLDLTNPVIGWVSISKGMGVPAKRAETVEEFQDAFREALGRRGPFLIEAII
ncbi:MAG: acetolactate synthase large subunit [Parvularculaceae bacterium]